jgi:cytochrome c oxidase cbb3-type subunit 3
VSTGLNAFIIILTVLNIVGACWLMIAMRKRNPGETGPSTETTGHVWDGDLGELNNPLPRWWLWGFFISVAFSIGYLYLYPGLGSYAGSLGWTSTNQHTEIELQAEAQAQQVLAHFKGKSIEQLVTDPEARTVGRNLFANNCAVCHGSDAHGNTGFPNLTDKDWLWGGAPEQVEATITGGRNAVMIAWQAVLGDQGIDNAAAYVLSLSGRKAPAGNVAEGKTIFMTTCLACHGEDGRGNQVLGAPNLTDNIWLYGGSFDTVRATIANGRQGQMPAQGERLGADRVRLLAAYVLSLGNEPDAH